MEQDELKRIADIIERAERDRSPPPRPDNGQPRRFLSGRWHRRDGTVYRTVAYPGSPNAGSTDGT